MNGDGHVARLVKRRRDRPHGITQVDRPQQEEELGYNTGNKEERDVMKNCRDNEQMLSSHSTDVEKNCLSDPFGASAVVFSGRRMTDGDCSSAAKGLMNFLAPPWRPHILFPGSINAALSP